MVDERKSTPRKSGSGPAALGTAWMGRKTGYRRRWRMLLMTILVESEELRNGQQSAG